MNLKISKKINWLELAGIIYTFSIVYSISSGAKLVMLSRLFIVAIAILLVLKTGRVRKCNKIYYIWSTVFVTYCGMSILWASSKSLAVSGTMTVLYIVIVNWIIYYAISLKHEYVYTLMKTVIWAAIFHALRVFLTNGFTVYLASRGGASVENATTLAVMTSFGAIFSFVILSNKKTHKRVMYDFALLLNVIFALLTASRKVFLYIGIFLIVYYVFKAKSPLKLIRNIIAVLIVGLFISNLVLNVSFLYNLVGYRIVDMISGLSGGVTDSSTSFRLHLIAWGLEWFKEKPIWGYGINCYKFLLGSNYSDLWTGSRGVYAHNNFIELLVDTGIVGFVLYYSIYFLTLIRGLKAAKYTRTNSIVAIALITTMIINELGQVSYSIPILQEALMFSWFFANQNQKTEIIPPRSSIKLEGI